MSDDKDIPLRAGTEMLKQFAANGYDPLLMVFASQEVDKGLAVTGPMYLRYPLQAVPEAVDVLTKTVHDYLAALAAEAPMDDWPGQIISLRHTLDKPKEPS